MSSPPTTTADTAPAPAPATAKEVKSDDNDGVTIGTDTKPLLHHHPFDARSPRTASTLWFRKDDANMFLFLESLCLMASCFHASLELWWWLVNPTAAAADDAGQLRSPWPKVVQWTYILEIVMATISLGLQISRRQRLVRVSLCTPIVLALSVCTDALMLFGCCGGGNISLHCGHIAITVVRVIYTPFVLINCVADFEGRWSGREHED